MTKFTLRLEDEVNCKFIDLDPVSRRKIVEGLKYFVPHAKYQSAYRLGRWDGTVSYASVGGATFINLLDKIFPILIEQGYDLEKDMVIEDLRQQITFNFQEIDEEVVADRVWPKGHAAEGEPIMLRDYQVDAINTFLKNPHGIQILPTGSGKCQPLHSKVLTPNGWKTMGEMQVGELVTIPNGSNVPVLDIYKPGSKQTYRITFEDGRTAECCGDHIWKVTNIDWSRKNPWKHKTTQEIIDHMASSKRPLAIPLVSMENDNSDVVLPLDPWFMGFMLGDGSFRHGFSFSTKDEEVIDRIQQLLHNDYKIRTINNCDYIIEFKTDELRRSARSKHFANGIGKTRSEKEYFHFYKNLMQQLGLMKLYSHEKFIPIEFMNGSRNQRLELIRGLLDSDGYVGKSGGVSFSTTSKQLALDFQSLIRSIGGIAKIQENTNCTYKYKDEIRSAKDNYTVVVRYRNMPELLSLARKKKRAEEYINHKEDKLIIRKIEPIGEQEVRCLMIDHVDHLYLTDDYIVTHNTLTTATLSLQVEPYGRSLVIVPSKSLVVQTEADYKNMGMDVGVYFGDRKELGHKHTVSTWQSLVSLIKQTVDGAKDEDNDIFAMIKDVVCVITDEVHSAKADELKKMLTGVLANIPLRWGFTGTLPKDEISQASILVGLGPVIGELKAARLQELGVLSNCHVNIVQMVDDHVEYTSYHEENAFLTQDERRLQWLANFTQKVTENGNTLILVQNIETGKKLNEMIPDSVFVYGATKNSERFEHFDDINTGTNQILIASYGVASVGINIPRIFNLVLFEPGKSFVRVIQSIGRGVRIAKDKDFVNIYDITSTLKYSTRHLSARKTFYREAEYPFETYQVQYLNNEFGELELVAKRKTKKKKDE